MLAAGCIRTGERPALAALADFCPRTVPTAVPGVADRRLRQAGVGPCPGPRLRPPARDEPQAVRSSRAVRTALQTVGAAPAAGSDRVQATKQRAETDSFRHQGVRTGGH